MQLFLALTFAILATSHAQVTTCGLAESLYANPSKPHETYCNLFYLCDTAQTAWLMQCPLGTLYDSLTRMCTYPRLARCNNMQCDATTQGQVWSSYCCKNYIACNAGVFDLVDCPFGQVFDTVQRRCVTGGICTPHRMCLTEAVVAPTTAPPVCYYQPVQGNPCMFQMIGSDGTNYGAQNCAEGTSWNQLLCSCATFNSNCMRTVERVNTADAACPVALGLTFPTSSKRPVGYTMKTANGQRKVLGYYIETAGYQAGGTQATIRNVGTTSGFLHIYHYTQNMPKTPFGIKITFRADNTILQEGYSFSLVTNDFRSTIPACNPTLDVKAAWSAAGKWTITVYAATTSYDTTIPSASTFASVTASATDFVTVSIMQDVDKNIGGFVRTVNGLPVTLPSTPLNGAVGYNICGLRVAQGLIGTLRDVAFYESCNVNTALTTALSS